MNDAKNAIDFMVPVGLRCDLRSASTCVIQMLRFVDSSLSSPVVAAAASSRIQDQMLGPTACTFDWQSTGLNLYLWLSCRPGRGG
jgi:hypothetical protein